MRWKYPCENIPTGIRVPAGSFSWSMRRGRMFDFCPRAYFYHYYAAAGGWDVYAPEPGQQLYRMKRLWRTEDRAVDIFATAVRELAGEEFVTRPDTLKAAERRLNSIIQRKFRNDRFELLTERWRQDATAVNLFEIFYGSSADSEKKVIAYFQARLGQLAAGLTRLPLFETLAGLPPLKIKSLPPPVNFMAGNLEIWVAPTLVWEDGDRIRVLAVRGGNPPPGRDVGFSAGLFRLMAEQLCWSRFEKTDVFHYFTGKVNAAPELLSDEGKTDRGELIGKISADSARMLEKIRPDGTVRESDFQKWIAGAETICPDCRFYGF